MENNGIIKIDIFYSLFISNLIKLPLVIIELSALMRNKNLKLIAVIG